MKSIQVFFAIAMVIVNGNAFTNLSFDSPDLSGVVRNPIGGGIGNVDEILRGWSVFQDRLPIPVTTMEFGDSGEWHSVNLSLRVDSLEQQRFSLLVDATLPQRSPNCPTCDGSPSSITLSLRGVVPEDANYLQIFAVGRGEVSVELDYDRIDGVFGEEGMYSYYNVAGFRGREADLSISFLAGTRLGFDVVGFSDVPEPSVSILLLLGVAVVFVLRCRRC
jgi:hypothetical protein